MGGKCGMAGFFNYSKPGKGVSQEDLEKTGLELYFDILSRRLWKLVTLNLVYVITSIPALVIGWFISTFAIFYLTSFAGVDISGDIAGSVGVFGTLAAIILLQLCGSGPASAGMSYVLRKYVNDTHSWATGDFFENIKNNFKQGICVYLINIVLVCLFAVSMFYYAFIMKGIAAQLLLWIVAVAAAIFLMMQMYTYQLTASFKLKLRDIYRNAFLLTVAKFPWNLFAMVVSLFFTYAVVRLTISIPPAGIVAVGALFYSVTSFTQLFMTNNIIKELLLQPAIDASLSVEDKQEGNENEKG